MLFPRDKKLPSSSNALHTADDSRELLIALFGALCLFLSTLEYLIPKPLPFFRLGLANLPILLAFPLMNGREIILLTVLKVLGQALVNGTLTSYVFLFSLSGSVASVFVMYIAWRVFRPWISFVGISLLGALASNAVQIALSISFIFGATAWIIAPLFMGLGLGAGLAVGMSAHIFSRRSEWYKGLIDGKTIFAEIPTRNRIVPPIEKPKSHRRFRLSPAWDVLGKLVSAPTLFWAGIVILPAYFFQESLWVRGVQVLFFVFLALSAGKRVSLFYSVSIVASVVVFNLFAPAGKVLFTLAGFPITEHALLDGIYKGIGLIGLVMISLATVRGSLLLPGKLGRLLGGLFRYYEALLSQKSTVHIRNIIGSIDHILCRVAKQVRTEDVPKRKQKTSVAGWFLIASIVILQWALVFVQR